MNNELEMMELEQQETSTQNNETGGTYAENIKAAEMAGNKDMAEYYRQKELQEAETETEEAEEAEFEVDEKLNHNEEDEFGSSCADFCQKTRTNSSKGNYSSRGR